MLLVYLLLPGIRVRNLWLLAASLVFYAWGEPAFIIMLLVSVLGNYGMGLAVERSRTPARRKCMVAVGIAGNLGLLAYFKYFNLGIAGLNRLLLATGGKPVSPANILLPLGISFFTFHALSYLVNIYRQKQRAATRPQDVALYIFFFPQLIAGPILRWHAIAPQLQQREHGMEKFADGARRFVTGLAKKVLVANTVALPADQIFALPAGQLSSADAWLGIVCYTLQIYFDFSGYSDMAVGFGKMFGFQFLENFDFPYFSRSIREFWRRWHISLSTWFRDYVYFPLGGNRVTNARNCLNLVIVFFLCGLWHGASWTFVAWGLYHGLFLVLERTAPAGILEKTPRLLRHAYVLLVVMVGWVVFRADDFGAAAKYLYALAGLASVPEAQPLMRFVNNQVLIAIGLGILCSTPAWAWSRSKLADRVTGRPLPFTLFHAAETAGILGLFLLSIVWLAGETYNPFIYFRF